MVNKKPIPEHPNNQLTSSVETLRDRAEKALNSAKDLRKRSEDELPHKLTSSTESISPYSTDDAARIIHELQVHQIELEMQNQELLDVHEKLHYAQAQYYDLYDQAPVGYITLNAKGLILQSNQTAADLLGVSKAFLKNIAFNQFIDAEDQDIYFLYCQQLLEYKVAATCELAVLTADNKHKHLNLNSQVIEKDNGEPVQFRTILTDISSRIHAENQLLRSQVRLQTIVDTAVYGIVTIDKFGNIIMFNKAAEDMFQYTANEVIGHNVNKLMPTSYRKDHDRFLANLINTGHSQVLGKQREVHGLRKDGSMFPLRFSIGEFKEAGELYFTGMLEDITQWKQIEQEVKDSEERLRLVLDASETGFWDWHIQKKQVIHNEKWFELLGLTANEDMHKPEFITSLIHEDDRQTVLKKLNKAVTGSGHFRSEHRLRHADGYYIWVQENGIVVKWDKLGQPKRMVGIFVDISNRKTNERQQRIFQNHYERLLKLEIVNQTLSSIAHDINQPLSAATSYADAAARFMQQDDFVLENVQNSIDQVTQQIHRAGKVVHEMISFLHVGETILTPLDINKLITRVVSTLKEDGYLSSFTALLKLDKDIPLVNANSLQLEKVLINLIRNGVEAMNLAGMDTGSLIVKVTSCANHASALVSICDSGPGITQELAQKVFEPFFSTKNNGLGMGLAISRALMESQGGQLWCEENNENGATFHLTVPLANVTV